MRQSERAEADVRPRLLGTGSWPHLQLQGRWAAAHRIGYWQGA